MSTPAILVAAWLTSAQATSTEPLDLHMEAAAASQRAESRGDSDTAYRSCAEAIRLLPEGPRAQRCRSRLDFLDLRRDTDGSWRSWEALESIRRAYRTLDPSEARRQIVDLLAGEGIGPMVAADATLWLAIDSLDRQRDPEDALHMTDSAYADRASLDRHLAMRLISTRARALALLGRVAEAQMVEAEIRVLDSGTRKTAIEQIAREQQEQRITWTAQALIGVFLLVSGALALRPNRTWPRPSGLIPLVLVVLPSWILAEQWSHGAGAALPWMGLSFAAIHLITLAAVRRDGSRALQAVLASLSVVATFSAMWLCLAATDTIPWLWR